MNYFDVLTEILVLMAYIAIGYIARKLKIITENGILDMNRLIVNVTLPMLILKSTIIDYKKEYVINMLHISLAGLFFLMFAFIFSRKIVRSVKGEEKTLSSMRYCMIFGNASFLGYPLCSALFGELGVFYASMFVMLQNIFVWTIGINIFKKEKIKLSNLRRLINPGIVAITLGLSMFFLKIKPFSGMTKVIGGIGNITIPLALLIVGASLYGQHFRDIITDRKVQLITVIKTLIIPLVFLIIIYFIPMDRMIKSIFIIQAAAPVQVSAAAYAMNYGGDHIIPAKAVFLSTVLCLVTIPVFLFLINL